MCRNESNLSALVKWGILRFLTLFYVKNFSLDGGELFDRITDENYNLTELDAILFTRQICEGVHYLHQHYILHLDLKVSSSYSPLFSDAMVWTTTKSLVKRVLSHFMGFCHKEIDLFNSIATMNGGLEIHYFFFQCPFGSLLRIVKWTGFRAFASLKWEAFHSLNNALLSSVKKPHPITSLVRNACSLPSTSPCPLVTVFKYLFTIFLFFVLFTTWNWTAWQCVPKSPLITDLFEQKYQLVFFLLVYTAPYTNYVTPGCCVDSSAVVISLDTIIPPMPTLKNVLIEKHNFLPSWANLRVHLTCFSWLFMEFLLYLGSKSSG